VVDTGQALEKRDGEEGADQAADDRLRPEQGDGADRDEGVGPGIGKRLHGAAHRATSDERRQRRTEHAAETGDQQQIHADQTRQRPGPRVAPDQPAGEHAGCEHASAMERLVAGEPNRGSVGHIRSG